MEKTNRPVGWSIGPTLRIRYTWLGAALRTCTDRQPRPPDARALRDAHGCGVGDHVRDADGPWRGAGASAWRPFPLGGGRRRLLLRPPRRLPWRLCRLLWPLTPSCTPRPLLLPRLRCCPLRGPRVPCSSARRPARRLSGTLLLLLSCRISRSRCPLAASRSLLLGLLLLLLRPCRRLGRLPLPLLRRPVRGGARGREVLQLPQHQRVAAAQVELHLAAGRARPRRRHLRGHHAGRVAGGHERHHRLHLCSGQRLGREGTSTSAGASGRLGR